MTRLKRQRLALLAGIAILLSSAVALALVALRDNVVFFMSPSEIADGALEPGQRVRVGGLVASGSVVREAKSTTVHFELTDGPGHVSVVYAGILPDLFREGQGIVANGAIDAAGVFRADEVLAKHDESYMPPEVAEALKQSGHWEGEGPIAPVQASGAGQGAVR